MKKSNIHDRDGCGLMGYVYCSLNSLVTRFGPSLGPSLDGKVRAKWEYDTPVGVITIYDYKEDIPLDSLKVWYIGGHSSAVLLELSRIFPRHSICKRDGSAVVVYPKAISPSGPDEYVKSLGV